jgi:hypothetical protein
VQNMVEKNIMVCQVASGKLENTGQRLQMHGGKAALAGAASAGTWGTTHGVPMIFLLWCRHFSGRLEGPGQPCPG